MYVGTRHLKKTKIIHKTDETFQIPNCTEKPKHNKFSEPFSTAFCHQQKWPTSPNQRGSTVQNQRPRRNSKCLETVMHVVVCSTQ